MTGRKCALDWSVGKGIDARGSLKQKMAKMIRPKFHKLIGESNG